MDSGGGALYYGTPRPLPIGHFLTMLSSRTPPCWTGLGVENREIRVRTLGSGFSGSIRARERRQEHMQSQARG